MKPSENPLAQDFAAKIMAMNRKDRREYSVKNKLSFKVSGTNRPLIKNGNTKAKETS